jgi:hypothetical protein
MATKKVAKKKVAKKATKKTAKSGCGMKRGCGSKAKA